MNRQVAAIFLSGLLAGCSSTPEPLGARDLVISPGLQLNYAACNSRLLLEQRVDRAYQVGQQLAAPLYLFSGKGNPESLASCFDEQGSGLSEAVAMQQILMVKYGVAAEDILAEERSTTAEESALYLQSLIRQQAQSRDLTVSSLSLISSAYHNHRQRYHDGADNSARFYLNRVFGAGTFTEGENIFSSSELGHEQIWSRHPLLQAAANPGGNSSRVLGDVTGDGRSDLVRVDHDSGRVTLFLAGDGAFAEPVQLPLTFSGFNNLVLTDINGNGKADLVGSTRRGVVVAFNDGENSFRPERLWSREFAADANLHFADIDGNGKSDLVHFARYGVEVAVSQQGGFSTPLLISADFGSLAWVEPGKRYHFGEAGSDYPRFVADVTGNGAADLIAFGHDAVYVSVNDGMGRFSPRQRWLSDDAEGNRLSFVRGVATAEMTSSGWRPDSYWGAHYPRGVADINGNGRADLWAIGEHGVYVAWSADLDRDGAGDHFENINGVWVYESKWRHNGENLTAFRQFTPYRGWDVTVHPRVFADVNGNGRADLVGFGENAVYVAPSLHP